MQSHFTGVRSDGDGAESDDGVRSAEPPQQEGQKTLVACTRRPSLRSTGTAQPIFHKNGQVTNVNINAVLTTRLIYVFYPALPNGATEICPVISSWN